MKQQTSRVDFVSKKAGFFGKNPAFCHAEYDLFVSFLNFMAELKILIAKSPSMIV
jgi:hypothetical protein